MLNIFFNTKIFTKLKLKSSFKSLVWYQFQTWFSISSVEVIWFFKSKAKVLINKKTIQGKHKFWFKNWWNKFFTAYVRPFLKTAWFNVFKTPNLSVFQYFGILFLSTWWERGKQKINKPPNCWSSLDWSDVANYEIYMSNYPYYKTAIFDHSKLTVVHWNP